MICRHPLDFIPSHTRRSLFLVLVPWTLLLMVLMQFLNSPLRTSAAPAGIVSFELAGTPDNALSIIGSWIPKYNPAVYHIAAEDYKPLLYAAFSLGFDYLFMVSYAITIALGILLAAGRHGGKFATIGIWLGWGLIVAALLDAVENIVLWRILTGDVFHLLTQLAFWCASLKFSLILLGLIFALIGWLLPRNHREHLV
ncbi:MAG: hypothetical protein MUP03_08500 [Anaerolineales bacterium]|nr:hypothetical protein [Anaerolineales bacterium]